MPNRFVPLQPGTDDSQKLAIINKNFAELDNENVIKLMRDTNGDNRLIQGRLPDGSFGLVISKEGYDVVEVLQEES